LPKGTSPSALTIILKIAGENLFAQCLLITRTKNELNTLLEQYRMDDMVSMHHRLPEHLRRRLKIAAAQRGLAMTDIINQSIEMWLDQEFERMADERVANGSIPAAVSCLMNVQPSQMNALLRNLPKDRIVLILSAFGVEPDTRHSFLALIHQLTLAIEQEQAKQASRAENDR
jgi:hypothetical protein